MERITKLFKPGGYKYLHNRRMTDQGEEMIDPDVSV